MIRSSRQKSCGPARRHLAATPELLEYAPETRSVAFVCRTIGEFELSNDVDGHEGFSHLRLWTSSLFEWDQPASYRQEMITQQFVEGLGSLLGEEDSGSLQLHGWLRSGNRIGQPVRPLHRE